MRPDDPPRSREDILRTLAQMIDDREQDAHDALQVGGYLPLDPDYPVEIPLSLCYAARNALRSRAPKPPITTNRLNPSD